MNRSYPAVNGTLCTNNKTRVTWVMIIIASSTPYQRCVGVLSFGDRAVLPTSCKVTYKYRRNLYSRLYRTSGGGSGVATLDSIDRPRTEKVVYEPLSVSPEGL